MKDASGSFWRLSSVIKPQGIQIFQNSSLKEVYFQEMYMYIDITQSLQIQSISYQLGKTPTGVFIPISFT